LGQKKNVINCGPARSKAGLDRRDEIFGL